MIREMVRQLPPARADREQTGQLVEPVAGIGNRSYASRETAMGIDRIQKNSPSPPPSPERVDRGRAAESGRPFEVTGAQTGAPVAPGVEPPHSALDRWRAGEIDLNGYLDLKVREATAHLTTLPAPELDAIRSALRDRMAGDPTLVELVRTATGGIQEPPNDG
jgi:hypothetical protein